MADPTNSRRQMTASGLAGVLGLFAGLCAIFAGCVTVADWHVETAQARWPIVSALVERADVVVSARTPKDGGGTQTKLRYRVRYDVNGEQQSATLASRPAFSDTEAAKLQSWAAQHRKGGHIDIKYDPSQANTADFASAELSPATGRTGTDIVLFAIAAIASAGLLALARHLRAREAAHAAPAAQDSQSGRLLMGFAFAAMGLMLTGVVVYRAIHANSLTADTLMGLPAGLMFVFAGILLGLPPEYAKWRSLLATLVVTCFALTFDWVAFGPGERKFSGSIGGIGFIPGELLGRSLFGLCAVVLDIVAIMMWVGQCRRAFGLSTSVDTFSEQRS
jgi:hypothetical protein